MTAELGRCAAKRAPGVLATGGFRRQQLSVVREFLVSQSPDRLPRRTASASVPSCVAFREALSVGLSAVTLMGG